MPPSPGGAPGSRQHTGEGAGLWLVEPAVGWPGQAGGHRTEDGIPAKSGSEALLLCGGISALPGVSSSLLVLQGGFDSKPDSTAEFKKGSFLWLIPGCYLK